MLFSFVLEFGELDCYDLVSFRRFMLWKSCKSPALSRGILFQQISTAMDTPRPCDPGSMQRLLRLRSAEWKVRVATTSSSEPREIVKTSWLLEYEKQFKAGSVQPHIIAAQLLAGMSYRCSANGKGVQ